jgi:hypothetical protein
MVGGASKIKNLKFFNLKNSYFLVFKNLNSDPVSDPDSPKILDPDLDSLNPYKKHSALDLSS